MTFNPAGICLMRFAVFVLLMSTMGLGAEAFANGTDAQTILDELDPSFKMYEKNLNISKELLETAKNNKNEKEIEKAQSLETSVVQNIVNLFTGNAQQLIKSEMGTQAFQDKVKVLQDIKPLFSLLGSLSSPGKVSDILKNKDSWSTIERLLGAPDKERADRALESLFKFDAVMGGTDNNEKVKLTGELIDNFLKPVLEFVASMSADEFESKFEDLTDVPTLPTVNTDAWALLTNVTEILDKDGTGFLNNDADARKRLINTATEYAKILVNDRDLGTDDFRKKVVILKQNKSISELFDKLSEPVSDDDGVTEIVDDPQKWSEIEKLFTASLGHPPPKVIPPELKFQINEAKEQLRKFDDEMKDETLTQKRAAYSIGFIHKVLQPIFSAINQTSPSELAKSLDYEDKDKDNNNNEDKDNNNNSPSDPAEVRVEDQNEGEQK